MGYDIYPTLPGIELTTCSVPSAKIPLGHSDGLELIWDLVMIFCIIPCQVLTLQDRVARTSHDGGAEILFCYCLKSNVCSELQYRNRLCASYNIMRFSYNLIIIRHSFVYPLRKLNRSSQYFVHSTASGYPLSLDSLTVTQSNNENQGHSDSYQTCLAANLYRYKLNIYMILTRF